MSAAFGTTTPSQNEAQQDNGSRNTKNNALKNKVDQNGLIV